MQERLRAEVTEPRASPQAELAWWYRRAQAKSGRPAAPARERADRWAQWDGPESTVRPEAEARVFWGRTAE